jgi:hypothetical protein
LPPFPPIGGRAIHPAHRLVGGQTPLNRAGIVFARLAKPSRADGGTGPRGYYVTQEGHVCVVYDGPVCQTRLPRTEGCGCRAGHYHGTNRILSREEVR